ncbi:MAG: hypothetical protein A2176_04830 [Spirochaetes bacterium RBG_13_51_14]|nr:MAG: hypothetical protein A2176_04830 [Spirochaetes bacterium RBG_13_51_14]
MKKVVTYPAEITFKSVFVHRPDLHEIIVSVLADHGIAGEITHRPSRNSKFISYTITAEFNSASHVSEVCCLISEIKGFLMMI